ncbi:MAG: HD family phosphohydrolase, partial [Gemmatimonadota bacterium]
GNLFGVHVEGAADSLVADPGNADRQELRDLLSDYSIPPSATDVSLLLDSGTRARLRESVRQAIRTDLARGVAMSAELDQVDSRRLAVLGLDLDDAVPMDSVLGNTEFYDRAERFVPGDAPDGFAALQRVILVRFMVPSLRPDWEATELYRERARGAVSPIKTRIQEQQRIVPAREPVTEADVERFRAYRQELERLGRAGSGRWVRVMGGFLFNLLVLSLFGVLVLLYREALYRNLRHLVVITALVLTLVGVASIVAASQDRMVALIPIAFPALVVATLWDGRLALSLSLILAVFLTGQAPFLGIVSLLTLVAAGAAASLSVRVVRRRAQTWVFIALIAGAYVLVDLVLTLRQGWGFNEMARFAGLGAVNAIASAFAAMGFLPVLEGYTRITTDQTLLELADANRPLLRRLSMEAPGTYAHTINVANLAEAAANAIGANALLTRVGVYYHDVGKIDRPQYFIENQPSGRNPHDRLKPATSAHVVRSHVLDGLELADEAKLPECIRAFIREHHGTQSISFFYEQAREADPDAELDPEEFAYPGPRPRSRETAIVMLADSVESAARVLPDPSPESITELVDRIVQAKLDARQLDEAPLTLGELARIKEQFVNVLMGMYHQRIDYPPAREGNAARGGRPATPDTVETP